MRSLKGQSDFLHRMQWTIAAVMVLLVGAFYVLIYRPQTLKLTTLQGQIKQTRTELIDAQAQTTMLPLVEADVEQLKLRLAKFKTLPKRDELEVFVKDIAQITQQTALKNPVMTKGATRTIDKINEIPINLKFEGDFGNAFTFLRNAERMQRLTRVPKLNIRSSDNAGQIKAELTMNVYYMAD